MISCERACRCKIGCTARPTQRLKQIRLQSPFQLKFAGYYYAKDMYSEERFWHKKFANRRVHGEWFHLKRYEELLLLLSIMTKGYETLVAYEIEQSENKTDARRRIRNLQRRTLHHFKKTEEALKAGLLPANPRTGSRGKEYCDPQRFERLNVI